MLLGLIHFDFNGQQSGAFSLSLSVLSMYQRLIDTLLCIHVCAHVDKCISTMYVLVKARGQRWVLVLSAIHLVL